jgi:hypothetical protein
LPGANIRYRSHWEIRTPARNIVGICSGSHEKKVNLGEVFSELANEVGPLTIPPALPPPEKQAPAE